MKSDDPRLTAYVVEELTPEEESRLLRDIEADALLANELDQLHLLSENLRTELRSEPILALTPEQRAAILGECNYFAPIAGSHHTPWWRNPWIPAAAAAVVVAGLAATIYFQARHIHELTAQQPAGLISVPVPGVAIPALAEAGEGDDRGLSEGSRSLENADSSVDDLRLSPALPAWNPTPSFVWRNSSSTDFASAPKLDNGTTQSGPSLTSTSKRLNVGEEPKVTTPPAMAATRRASERNGGAAIGVPRQKTLLDGEIRESESTSATAVISPPPILEPRVSGKRPTAAEKKIQKELKDLKSRLESLERLQRREWNGSAQDPTLRQTVEHVRRTLVALQAAQDGLSITETYDQPADNPFVRVKDHQLSAFSVDVDTASYANVRRVLNSDRLPPPGAVRIEELLNYFRYNYPRPTGGDPFACLTEVASCPWAPNHRLVRIGIKGREIPPDQRPPANLVFLIDVSGSMRPDNKLPLIKDSLRLLTDQLGPDDSVALVVYGGASGCVLEPTRDMNQVRVALGRLEAGGPKKGASGIQLAYDLAQRSFKRGASNRVILCTDGDFNVGISDSRQLLSLVQGKAKTGVSLSVLGFGYGGLNDPMVQKLADKGNGAFGFVDTITEGRRLFQEQLTGTLVTIAKDVKVQVEFNPSKVAEYRLIGYENRRLTDAEFEDDQVNAGEIGAGHTVTALYEVVPSESEGSDYEIYDELKYGPHQEDSEVSPELLTVKIRYKLPDNDVSSKKEFALTDLGTNWDKTSDDFRWAAAVAGFGMLLRDSPHKSSLSWSVVDELIARSQSGQLSPERQEFVRLIQRARNISR